MRINNCVLFALLLASIGQDIRAQEKAHNQVIEVPFEKRFLGDVVSLQTSLPNPTRNNVAIKNVAVSCDCLKVEPAAWDIIPGSDVKLAIKVEGVAAAEGLFRKTIVVTTDSATNPRTIFVVTGEFVARDHRLLASPVIFDIGTATPGQAIDQTVVLNRAGLIELGAVQTRASADWLSVTRDADRSTSQKAFYNVTASVPPSLGAVNEEIRITGAGDSDFVRILVTGRVRPPVRVMPSRVLLEPAEHLYLMSVKRDRKDVGKLVRWELLEPTGMEVRSCEESVKNPLASEIALMLDARGTGYVGGILQLTFEGVAQPVQVQLAGWVVHASEQSPRGDGTGEALSR